MLAIISSAVLVVSPIWGLRILLLRRILSGWSGFCLVAHAFKYLIEFTPVEPHAPALRAIINFDALAFGHLEIGIIDWTFHSIGWL